MPWPRWEVRARHDNKKLHKSDEFSQDLLDEKAQFFASLPEKIFDSAEDDYRLQEGCRPDEPRRRRRAEKKQGGRLVHKVGSVQRVSEDPTAG